MLFPHAKSLAGDAPLVCGAVYDCARNHAANSTVYHDIHKMAKAGLYHFGVCVFLNHLAGEGCAQDGVVKGFKDLPAYAIVWHPQSDGVPLALEKLGNLLAGGQDEGKRAGKVVFEHPVKRGVYAFGKIAEVAQVAAYDG